jgi:hypothetical protein
MINQRNLKCVQKRKFFHTGKIQREFGDKSQFPEIPTTRSVTIYLSLSLIFCIEPFTVIQKQWTGRRLFGNTLTHAAISMQEKWAIVALVD